MKPFWRAVGWTSGALTAAATGLVFGASKHKAKIAEERREAELNDPYVNEPFGALTADRYSTVAADDGVPIAVQEVNPADGGEPELTVVLAHGYTLDSRCWHFQRRDLPELTDPRVRLVLYDQRRDRKSVV